jgi:hypothetical protein
MKNLKEFKLRKFSNIDEYKMCKLYIKGWTSYEISQKFNCKKYNVILALKRNNISYRHDKSNDNRKYTVLEDYFKNIDTQEKAYILGYMYADGCVHKNKLKLTLHRQDLHILKRIKKELKYTGTIYGIKDKYVTLSIVNKKLTSYLKNVGVVERKTYKIRFPDFIKDELIQNFIRGYFDGVGCIMLKKIKTRIGNSGVVSISIASNKEFLEGMSKYLYNKLNIKIRPRDTKRGVYILRTGGNIITTKILNYMYLNSTIHLQRKYKKYKRSESIIKTMIDNKVKDENKIKYRIGLNNKKKRWCLRFYKNKTKSKRFKSYKTKKEAINIAKLMIKTNSTMLNDILLRN